jgi:hypothetical protein
MNLFPLLVPKSATPDHVRRDDIHPAMLAFVPLIPSIALCILFVSSTAFTESISQSKYPEGYAAYRQRVSKFVPFLTPVWGFWVNLVGGEKEKKRVDELVWGQAVKSKKE